VDLENRTITNAPLGSLNSRSQMKKCIRILKGIAAFGLTASVFSCHSMPEAPTALGPTINYGAPGYSAFELDDSSTHPLGDVAILGSGPRLDIIADMPGIYDTSIYFTPASARIDSIVCPYPDTTIITLPAGKIGVSWSSPNLIAVWDDLEQD